jgi:hypothetical protein
LYFPLLHNISEGRKYRGKKFKIQGTYCYYVYTMQHSTKDRAIKRNSIQAGVIWKRFKKEVKLMMNPKK